jgi:hypothetical protein
MNLEDFAAIEAYSADPLGYCEDVFPWGNTDASLANHTGVRKWQGEILETIGQHLRSPETKHQPLRIAVASGHGIGKSALISMVIKWGLDTREDTRIVVTANTEPQLRTKTWPEVSKWAGLAITKNWFIPTAMSLASADPEHAKAWRADALTWSINNTESFAGLHNEGKRIIVIFDEASPIDDKVWDVTQGALTDSNTEIIWLAFGNPTRNTGAFRECFGKHRHLWKTFQIDSRDVEGTNKQYLQELVDTYGEDSDIVRVRVRGQFPSRSTAQFIATETVETAQNRADAIKDPGAPLIMGVDISRFGDDQSVIRFRQGRDARSIRPIKWRGMDTVFSANQIAQAIDLYKPSAVFIDGGGVGGGVVDILKARGYRVIEVQFGGAANDPRKWGNKRAEMWGIMRDWLGNGSIDKDQTLYDDLIAPEYFYQQKTDALILESKEEMKKRGLASPDDGDALALTFAQQVARTDMPTGLNRAGRPRIAAGTEYNVLG